jgi:tetratricopeptide (TPR) repeat protein
VTADTLDPRTIGELVALINHGNAGDAEQRASALLTGHPQAGTLWKVLSVALMRQGKDSLPALRRTTELLPRDAEAHYNLGAALHDRGQWVDALASLYNAIALEPNNADALVAAANTMKALKMAQEAIPLYLRALELQPKRVEAHNNLGNSFLELGRYRDAVQCYARALALRPVDGSILCNLSNALRLAGQLAEALRVARRAVAQNPLQGAAFATLGDVLRDAGNRGRAVSAYARAVELDPNRAQNHRSMGNMLFELRRMEAAASSYRRAAALEPRDVSTYIRLSAALRALNRPSEAEASCQAALTIDAKHVEALALLGELRADRGQFAEAEKLFLRAIAIDPHSTFAYAAIATHRKMTLEDQGWRARAEALLAAPLAPGHEVNLRFALGKYFDDTHQYDAAFAHYRHANEICARRGRQYDAAKLTHRVGEVMQSFDAAFLSRSAAWEHTIVSELPVFVVGMPRSGTSLAGQILASHPAIAGAGEVIFWDGALTAYRRAQIEGQVEGNGVPAIARAYLERLNSVSGEAARVVDKMPANFWYAGLIHTALPGARIIHMQRHPLDTCLSIYRQNFINRDPYTTDLDHMAHYYREYLRIMRHWRTVLPAKALLEVPYESLVTDPELWSRRMVEFIGLPWDPKCLDFHQTERAVITASKWQVRQRINPASVGHWKHYEKFLGPLLGLLDS